MTTFFTQFSRRKLFAYTHDIIAACAAVFLAYSLRFNFEISAFTSTSEWLQISFWLIAIQSSAFAFGGLYQRMWRYASVPDITQILFLVTVATLIFTAGVVLWRPMAVMPRSVLLLQPILLAAFACGSRLIYRIWHERKLLSHAKMSGEPVIVLGAGDAAISLLRELARNTKFHAVGALDDDPAKQGLLIHGVRVMGKIDDYAQVARYLGVKQAILAMPNATYEMRRHVTEICTAEGSEVLTIPSIEDLAEGRFSADKVRKVEVADLLGREPVALDTAGLNEFLKHKVVMVTGAGGSIGSELCRQISAYQPSLMVFFEANEFAMYRLEQEFTEKHPDISFECVMGDVKNVERVEQVLSKYAPSVIFHAAAYKHVPMMEQNNSWEAVQNNVLGTYVLAQAAIKHQVKKFVFISTDKAVNPTNVMGASKRLAEIVCQALQQQNEARTSFEMVRFGNVLGSAGSVIPKFEEQIARGGPVTVTHPDIIRYFMSIPEAAQLVLQAGSMGKGGEVFVMDMGKPVKIADLARDMIRLSGFKDGDIRLTFTGLRPGEKLFEELLSDEEHTLPTPHPKLRVARARAVDAQRFTELVRWISTVSPFDDVMVKRQLKRFVPEFEIDEKHITLAVSNVA